MQFDLRLSVPAQASRRIVRDLHRQVREAIVSGRLLPGARLPPTREFATQYGVSRSTATAVYELLLAEGFLTARQGAGTFVATSLRRPAAARPPKKSARRDPRLARRVTFGAFAASGPRSFTFDLRLGAPEQRFFPFSMWSRLSSRVLRELARRPATYFEPAGPTAFRQAVAAHVSHTRAVACDADNIVATNGAQQAFDLIARTLVEPGKTIVAVEDPGYPPLRAAFAAAGARLAPIPVDDNGLIVARLPRDARIVCVTPSHQFPTGAVMSLERRNALLEFAHRNQAVIVEDDYDSEFRFGGSPLDALQTLDRGDAVFYVGTFSKSMFPALRLGFLVAPAWARDAIVDMKRITAWHGPALSQLTLAAFIEQGHLARHVRRMRRIYMQRRAALHQALTKHAGERLQIIPSEAGLHFAAWLARGMAEQPLVEACAAMGVGIERMGRYYMQRGRVGLAFGYGCCAEEGMDEVARRLARALA